MSQPRPGEPYYQPGEDITQSAEYGRPPAGSRYPNNADGEVSGMERRAPYPNSSWQRATIRYWAIGIIYFLLGVLEVILGLRWLFRLLGANTESDFIRSLYDLSHIFVAPFNNIFNDQTLGRQGVFEFSTLIAMLVYALIAWGLVTLINLLLRPTPLRPMSQ